MPGTDAIPLLGLDRETVEVNVTPDRGYCFSVRGIAREYSHATGAAFTDPALALAATAPGADRRRLPRRAAPTTAPIRGRAGCDRYVARVVRGIDVTAPTPRWMAVRLTEAGHAPDLAAGRRHELRHARPRPAAARLRPRHARGARSSCAAPAPASG